METVLIIDDETNIRTLLTRVLTQERREIRCAVSGSEGLRIAADISPDVVLVDLRLPDLDGMAVLKALRNQQPDAAVLMITAFGRVESAVEAMRNGAIDYLEKPFAHLDKLRLAVERALNEVKARREIARLHELQEGEYRTDHIIGESDSTKHLRQLIRRLAQSEAPTTLILGESGTGKELVAKGLHYEGPRGTGPLTEVNCAAITETLFESELFGHEKGAFTDARTTKKGLIEVADGGTLFLDEVGDMSLGSQAKLLRCLEEREFKRVGGTRDIKVDVRVIAATNRSLEALIKEGKFREDLFYRLNVIPISIPPLRERKEDILPLVRHFLSASNRAFHKAIKGLVPETESLFLSYPWPGNVRELKNLIERLVILGTSEYIEPEQLPPPFAVAPPAPPPCEPAAPTDMTLAEAERVHVLRTLNGVGGNKSQAAKLLGITRHTLKRKLGEP